MDILDADNFYHIYNRANAKVNLFENEDNYFYFLGLMKKHLIPISEIYSYCLLPNHFHLLIRIKDNIEKPSQAFSNLFNAYTKAFNKKFDRTGSLFQRPFKRKRVSDEKYLQTLIVYIHCNPQLHGLTSNFKEYIFSSYPAIISTSPTSINRLQVIDLFENLSNLKKVHQSKIELPESLALE